MKCWGIINATRHAHIACVCARAEEGDNASLLRDFDKKMRLECSVLCGAEMCNISPFMAVSPTMCN